ncbi:MAG: MFS transporter [Proteobacteria bacterium]|nr:MFS transporter [Pseudomonadota bacterium]
MTAATESPPFVPSAHPYRWAMLAGVWLIYYCFGLTVAAMAPLVLPITRELGLSHSAMGGVLGAWPLVYIASAVPCGAMLDRFGLRVSLFLAALLIGLSGLFRSLAVDHLSLFLAVAVFGLGGPLISVGAPKLISLWFDGKERGLAMGIYISGPALGNITSLSLTNSVMMPLLGGNWRTVLLSYAVFVLGAGAGWLVLSAHPASRAVERRAAAEPRRPQLQVFADLIRVPSVRIVLVMSVGMFFFNHGLNNWLPEILRTGGMDAMAAGFWASIPTAVGVAGALVIPRLAVPSRRLAILFTLFACAGGATLLIHSPAGPLLALGLTLQGIARSSMMAVSVLVLMETREVGSRYMGAAGGMFFSAAEMGGVLGPLTIGILYDLTGGFAAALNLLTGICVALMLLLWVLRRTTARASAPVANP